MTAGADSIWSAKAPPATAQCRHGFADTPTSAPAVADLATLIGRRYAVRKLDGYGLSHLLLMGNTTDFTGTSLEPLMGDGMFRHFRPIFRGKLIANVGMTAERGNRLIAEGFADLVAFGRPYIANPDLVERLATGAPLAEVDWKTVYASGPRGYADYPAIRWAAAEGAHIMNLTSNTILITGGASGIGYELT